MLNVDSSSCSNAGVSAGAAHDDRDSDSNEDGTTTTTTTTGTRNKQNDEVTIALSCNYIDETNLPLARKMLEVQGYSDPASKV